MLEYNKSLNILISEMILFFMAHILYALLYCPREAIYKVTFWVLVFTVLVIAVRIVVKDKRKTLTIYWMVPFLATHLIGHNTRTLAYGFLIYLITDIIFCVLLEPKINIMYIVAANISFLYSLIVEYDMVTEMIPVQYFWLVILCTNAGMVGCAYVSVAYCRRLEENERQKEELIEAQKSKDEFLANMSHEIRTPMNSVCGMTELMLRDEKLSEESRDYAVNIQSAARSLLGIINDILDFSKIESGKMQLVEEPYNFCSMLNDVIVLAMARKGDKNLELIIDCDPDIPSQLIGDELRLKQVIINLLTNAIKFTDEGAVFLDIQKEDTVSGIYLKVSVKDTGIGIRQENIEKLFDSFQQVDTKKNRNVEGTGLGLAICQKIVDMMDGSIQVESEYGEGSEFRFMVPQGVYKKAPCISIMDTEKLEIYTYLKAMEYEKPQMGLWYRQEFDHLTERLHVNTKEYNQWEAFRDRMDQGVSGNAFVFTSYENYQKYQSYFDELGQRCDVIVVMEKGQGERPAEQIQVLYKPFYALSVANAINHKKNHVMTRNQLEKEVFTAPKAKVLIVDDNPMNLKVTKGLLGPYQVQTTLALSGIEALKQTEKEQYDLILMDHMMPGKDGIETAEEIRARGGWCSQVPIVALTANAIEGVREIFIAKGFQDFVAKPIEISQLERTLKKWLPKKLIERNESVAGKIISENPLLEDVKFDILDTETALHYFDGNAKNYIEALHTYLEMGKENIRQLQEFVENEKWEEYTVKIHSLKSTSLTIGAKRLSEKAKLLELAGTERDKDFIKSHHEKMIQDYRKVLKDIKAHLPKKGQREKQRQEIDRDSLRQQLDRLGEGLAQFDVEIAQEVLDGLRKFSYRGKALEQSLKEVMSAVEEFDFAEAEKQLKSARAAMKAVPEDASVPSKT